MTSKNTRNPGMPLNLDWVLRAHINRSAVERRVATIPTRRTVKKEWQAAWLLRAITCMDLTTLSGDDTPGRVRRLCAKARQPVRPDMLGKLGFPNQDVTVGAVCVYPSRVKDAVEALKGSNIPVASVAAGFPAGQTPLPQRIAEIEQAIESGAREIDIVITRTHVLTGDWQSLYDEICQFRKTCGDAAHMKTILATGDLGTLTQIYQASLVVMMAGSDFIKTSTGKEEVNATLEFGLVMTRAIREYHEITGFKVGFKPAGGISKAKQALAWQALMKEELGDDWLMPGLFRIGASSLLTDLERQLYHFITGHYAARHHMPMG
ncbi:MAG: deoxyribose-phosphate aldolase [Chloroflexi bacterium GWB2_49_20]|nr:MAG: deoxyribose-phosphate aldolase [Chloroflexi bacterium GWB2_49_20]OGN79930.1 MAG: deoxyribose-phosphate aldolase [Chloroflexi bacterium GWC2_49_37]OGN85535.1 MAG: deoxyribose-phosphate aldolase [Chloroflexi bacterium GWD2_49_16]HBG74410.1 deoxyribose-phosphate aldolase [Anaerolineae bacterium]HCM96980.1 deoxyribose-phosphate aldolase [Anaerolineae bacterium]